MSRKNITVIVIILILIAANLFLTYTSNIELISYKDTIKELENKNSRLEKEIEKINYNSEKYKGIIGMYDMGIRNLYEKLNTPIYLGNDKETLYEAYELVKGDEVFKDKLIFALGPIRRDSNEVFYVDFYTFEQIDREELYKNTDNFMPTDLYVMHSTRFTKINNKLQYQIND